METSLAQQSSESVFAKEELIIAFIQESFPSLDMSPGTVIRDLVIRLYAHLETRLQEQIDLALISSSLLEISKNPNVVDEEQVERLLSNYNVVKSEGAKAFGKVRIFLNSSNSVFVDANADIVINDITFNPKEAFVLLPAESYSAAPNQRLITRSGTAYTALIDVVASTTGSEGNMRSGSLVASLSPAPATFVSAKVDSDFSGGQDADDNVALLAKMRTGIVGKVFGGREHIKAKLKNAFPGIMDVGSVGFLDPEMKRDLVNGVHSGGRIDIFVKSASYPSRIQEQVIPKLVSFNSVDKEGLFEIVFDENKSSGLYIVESIKALLTQLGSYDIVSDVRALGNFGNHYIEDISKSAFSAYQRVTVKFTVAFDEMVKAWSLSDPAPDISTFITDLAYYIDNQQNLGIFKFYVEYLKLPDLQEIQAYVDLASERSLSADMLVHAPIPVLSSLQIRLLKKTGSSNFDLAKLKSALTSKFNSYGFGERIPGSALVHTVYENVPEGYTVDLPIHMYGVVINPDLSKDVIFSSDALQPPTIYEKGVSPNNVAFFLESDMVDVSIKEC